MGVTVTAPNNGSDYVEFKNAAGTSLAKVGGYDDGTSNGHLEFYTTTGGTPTERARIDSAGNLGLGVTPSAWNSSWKAFEVQKSGNAFVSTAVNSSGITSNAYLDSVGWKYGANGYANFMAVGNGGGQYAWYTATSGTAGNPITFTQAMTLDASGRLGVGTTSPSSIIDLYGNFQTYRDGAYIGYVGKGSGVVTGAAASDFGVSSTTNLVFGTGASVNERMRIDSSGTVRINNTSTPSGNAGFGGETFVSGSSGNAALFYTTGAASGGVPLTCSRQNTGPIQYFFNNGTQAGHIDITGANTCNYATSSDYRLKENIQPMQNALATVAQLNPVTYTWKADGSDGQGFIAHELQAVVPDCVTGEKDAVDEEGNPVYQGIDTSFLVATLTKAIQEQQAQIETLTAKVAALEDSATTVAQEAK